MFEYALGSPETGKLIRDAVDASIANGIVTVDIAGEGNKSYSTTEVGDWVADFVAKN